MTCFLMFFFFFFKVSFENDPEAALITFANHSQANTAYRSSEPVFNNRFIKVFWHREKLPDQNPVSILFLLTV